MIKLWLDEGGRTLAILVCIEEEAPGCIKQDLLTQIDPGVFEHDFPPPATPDGCQSLRCAEKTQ